MWLSLCVALHKSLHLRFELEHNFIWFWGASQAHPWLRLGSPPLDLSFNDGVLLRDDEPDTLERRAHVLAEADVLLAQVYQRQR